MNPFKFAAGLVLAVAALLPLTSQAQNSVTIKLAYPKCAHCTPMALTPDHAEGIKLEAVPFNTGNDAMTALLSKSVDVAQLTYLHYATALDKGFDVVAISGQINGGSQILINNELPLKENDWAGLKKLIAEYKAQGKPFRIAASRGNAQDIHMRGAFAKQGIDVNKDVQFVNIPNPADHLQALRRNEIELVCTVEPFATQVRQLQGAKFFAFPYDQAAGNLTNLVVTRSDVVANQPKALEAIVRSIIKVNGLVENDKQLWVDTISRITGLDKAIAAGAVANLYPDYKMHRTQALAVGAMMRDLKYIGTDVSSKIDKNLDYRFLEAATGKTKRELGY